MVYQMEAILVTLKDLQDHSPITRLFECNFCAVLQQLTEIV